MGGMQMKSPELVPLTCAEFFRRLEKASSLLAKHFCPIAPKLVREKNLSIRLLEKL
jgi:hypothetical protein